MFHPARTQVQHLLLFEPTRNRTLIITVLYLSPDIKDLYPDTGSSNSREKKNTRPLKILWIASENPMDEGKK